MQSVAQYRNFKSVDKQCFVLDLTAKLTPPENCPNVILHNYSQAVLHTVNSINTLL